MLIDTVVIKLTRYGSDSKPDYSLEIKGDGRVKFQGIKNVKVGDTVKASIEREKIVSLLSDFKKLDFFNLKDLSEESKTRQNASVISLSIEDEEGITRQKELALYDDDVPNNLLKLKDKIIKSVNAGRWIGKKSSSKSKRRNILKDKKIRNKKDKKGRGIFSSFKNKKFLIGVLSVLVIATLIIAVVMSGILDFQFNKNGEDLEEGSTSPSFSVGYMATIDEGEYGNLSSILSNGSNPLKKSEFSIGETIWLFYRFNNFTHNGNFSIIENVKVYYNGNIFEEYNEKFSGKTSSEELYNVFNLSTNQSMEVGKYKIELRLTDNISGDSVASTCDFNLAEKSPEILVLTTASDVRSYQDYDAEDSFEQGDRVYVYTEYTDIETIDNGASCDVYLKLNVTLNGVNYYNLSEEKSLVKNNTHAWWFKTNSTLPTGRYDVNLHLIDNISNKKVNSSCSFNLAEKSPEILVLTTASDVRSYQDYDAEDSFEQGDRVYVYTEYTGISTFDGTLCDLLLRLNVTSDGDLYFSDVVNKTSVGNNSHAWWFTTDSSWVSNRTYAVSLYLMDRSSAKSVTSDITFSIS
ncbi:MAG: DUF6438 domain-containing protein [Candidatus Thermoplasmatota archaeon]